VRDRIRPAALSGLVLALGLALAVPACQELLITTREEYTDWFGVDPCDTPSVWPAALGKRNVEMVPGCSNLYRVRLENFQNHKAVQERQDFCWAACVQMVLAFHGQEVSQKDIVENIKGPVEELQDGTGSVLDILAALNTDWEHAAFVTAGDPTNMTLDLAANWPVIVGLIEPGAEYGHACILTDLQMSWHGPPGGAVAILDKVRIYDPLTDKRLILSAADFRDQVYFSIHLHELGAYGW